MNQHVMGWLGAYHDGELEESRRRQVEAHLQSCESCRAELNRLRALARLLQASPLPEGLTPPERFVSQVRLQLQPRPAQPAWQPVLEMGWRLAPLGLLGAWGFAQAVFLVSAAVLVALGAGLDGNLAMQWLPSAQDLWAVQILTLPISGLETGIGEAVLQFLGDGWLSMWSFALETSLLVVIGLLYWSWLASWWVRQQRQRA
jgi:anti-sigma factor RsiW